MLTFPDLQMREVQERTQRARALFDEGRWQEAKEGFATARALARRLGFDSAYLATFLAATTEQLGDLERAFSMASEAIALDPVSQDAIRCFNGIAHRLRSILGDPTRSPGDPSTPRLYSLLLQAGEADVPCHLAQARYQAAVGNLAEATALADAVLRLAPVSRDAWLLRADILRASGCVPEAAVAEARAALLATAKIPFGLPTPLGAAC